MTTTLTYAEASTLQWALALRFVRTYGEACYLTDPLLAVLRFGRGHMLHATPAWLAARNRRYHAILN